MTVLYRDEISISYTKTQTGESTTEGSIADIHVLVKDEITPDFFEIKIQVGGISSLRTARIAAAASVHGLADRLETILKGSFSISQVKNASLRSTSSTNANFTFSISLAPDAGINFKFSDFDDFQ